MARWWVVCLCAEWCGVCREYRTAWQALAARRPDAAWRWIDVEDDADLVGDLEVETFPTLLIGEGATVRFLGPLAPHIGVLERLLDSLADAATPGGVAEHAALLARIQSAHPRDLAKAPDPG